MDVEVIYKGIDDFNREVKQWGDKVKSLLKSNVKSMATKGTGSLAKKIGANYRKPDGEIESISYKFPRYGIFFAKGVGRGHVMQNGRVVRGIKNNKTVTLTGGTINREPKDWFNSTVDKTTSELADIVAKHKADKAAINLAHLKIK
ncbi:hypothetical protein ACT29H_09450 [Thermophagus sp. OGC60D27]|uniref:hypothetical protein n=1 Tax=Thermophagus sp. OGC60D27 TaxID=3458415 RepID=UPI004037833C